MVVFAVGISRRMMELRWTSLQCGRRTLLTQQCNSISGMARLTSRQGHLRRSGSERGRDLCGGSSVRIEEFARLLTRRAFDQGAISRPGLDWSQSRTQAAVKTGL